MRNLTVGIFAILLSGCGNGFMGLAGANQSMAASSCAIDQVFVQGSCLTAMKVAVSDVGDDRTNLQAAIDQAVASGQPTTIILEPRTYNLSSCGSPQNTPWTFCLTINNANSLKIQGVYGQTQLLIGSPMSGAFVIGNSSDVTIQGISIDYNPAPYSQGVVTAIDSTSLTYQVDSGFMELDDQRMFDYCPTAQTCNPQTTNPLGEVFNAAGTLSRANTINDYFVFSAKENLGGGLWKLTSGNSSAFINVGDRIAFAPDLSGGIVVSGGTNVNFYQVDVFAAPSIGFFFDVVSGLIDLDHIRIMPTPGLQRILSTNADAFHFSGSPARIYLHDSSVTNNGDDFLNVNTPGLPVSATNGPQVTVTMTTTQLFKVGDVVQITDSTREILRLPGKGMANVVGVVPGATTSQLTLDRPLTGVQSGDFLFDVTTSSPNSSIANNTFGSGRGSFRFRSQNSSFINNFFSDPKWAILLFSIDSYWNEGPMTDPPMVSGNIVNQGTLQLFGLNWQPFTGN